MLNRFATVFESFFNWVGVILALLLFGLAFNNTVIHTYKDSYVDFAWAVIGAMVLYWGFRKFGSVVRYILIG
jgi:membrane protease YdiL (CAAX protease family)